MKRLTGVVMTAAAAGLIAYDIAAAASPERGDTISEVVREQARRRPIIAFALGVVVGHWFWDMGAAGREGESRDGA